MAIRAQTQAEPIPGYRLIERIGGGGFGEVWKAEAPGGLLKAIKFVHGTLLGNHPQGGLVHQELKALGRVKTVRHPYILSLERYDIIDGQLLIVMELADRNLWDRFKECEAEGLPGIPRDELLRYLAEAGEALDLMNIDYQLQHLDIKPQNLFLLQNHLKVADFGLVKDLEGRSAQVSGGVTPVYAAPETFEGVVSQYCDQYSLAIVYQELLTGQRPFNGSSVGQLLVQHTTEAPNLSSLPECDRGPIARALSKKPEDRFPTCAKLIGALRLGGGTVTATGPREQAAVSIETPSIVRLSPTRISERPPPPPAMSKEALSAPEAEQQPASAIVAPEEVTGDGVLFPALVIGLGGLGLEVLQQLRADLDDRCGPADFLPQLRLLGIDTDPDSASQAAHERGCVGAPCTAEGALEEQELVVARLNKPTHYLRTVRNRAILDSWLNLGMVCRLPRNQVTTDGLRILGRLGLVDNYRKVVRRLRAELESCVDRMALRSADRQTQLGVRSNRPRVYIVAGLGGGTGSGMFIDAAYIVREQLRRLGYAEPDVVGLFLLPPADPAAKNSLALGNAFAALTELHHYSSPEMFYRAFFDDSEEPLHDEGAPFARCIALPLPREERDPTAIRHAIAIAGDFLCRELISPLGRTAEEARSARSEPGQRPELMCQTFGAQRFAMPRCALRKQAAILLGLRLVESWVSAERGDLPQAVAARLADPSSGLDLRPETLIGLLKSSCERGLQRPPEAQFQAILQRCFGQSGDLQAAAVLGTLGQLEALLGQPDSAPTLLGNSLAQAAQAMRREQGQRLADGIADLVEDPRFRVGGAEEACRQIAAGIRETGQTQRLLHRELLAKAADAHTHIHALLCNLQKGSWWPGHKAKTAVELRQALEDFPNLRYQALVLEHLLAVYRGLLEDLPAKQKELTFARERLVQFQRLLREELGPVGGKADLGPGRHFFPAGCGTIDEAIDALLRSITMESMLEVDGKVETTIRRQFHSLLHVCLGPVTAFKELRAILKQQATAATADRIGKASVAAIYLKGQPDESAIGGELAAVFDEAAPKLAGNRPIAPEIRLLVVPADQAGERLGQLAKAAVRDVEVLPVAGHDDLFFYREQCQLPLADLPQFGLLAEEAYRQMTSSGYFTPHSRMDVPNWLRPTD